jgi:hypothetical protein
MPVAVRSIETERFDLKTLPEGFIVLRKMSYGQILQRRTMMKLSLQMGGKQKDMQGEMAMANARVNEFEFRTCIVEHNLEKEEGVLLNFTNPVDVASLDPKVGQEIEEHINKMNNLEDEEDESSGNSSGE